MEAKLQEPIEHYDMQDKMNKIHNIDCLEFMRQVPDNYFDLVLTDPPYGIGEDGKSNHTRSCLAKSKEYTAKNWDSNPVDKDFFDEIIRI